MKKKRTAKHWLKEIAMYSVVFVVMSIAVDLWRMKDMPIDVTPSLEGITLSGESIDVIEMSKEKPVVVYFWATWCSICKFVSPTVNNIGDSYHVVGVSGSSGEDNRVTRYLAAHDYNFENINDTRSDIFRQWGVGVTPTIAIINNGEVKFVTTGITTPPGLYARLWLANW
ncbi:protein disulfide oxidoreductase [uncultured Vibrio sp.]|uniref:protein disulfide oxidoreductase n=1 Tax=uncultured Vibrio sp. TaxID=114054 RepID=UPI0025F26002|nr:protein disulfide oxidoreductase [uncultured Vibrio sp.]